MKKTVALLLTSALLAGGVGVAAADMDRKDGDGARYGCAFKEGRGGGRHHQFSMADRMDRMARHLNLDAKQTEQVQAIGKKYEPEFNSLREKMVDNRNKLRELTDKEGAREADIRKLADAQGKLKADMIVLRSKMHQEIDKVLTKEQLEQRKQWREQRGKMS